MDLDVGIPLFHAASVFYEQLFLRYLVWLGGWAAGSGLEHRWRKKKDGVDSSHSRFSDYTTWMNLAISEAIPKRATIETARDVNI